MMLSIMNTVRESKTLYGDVGTLIDEEPTRGVAAIDDGLGRPRDSNDFNVVLVGDHQPTVPRAGSYLNSIAGLRIIDGALEIHQIDMRLLPAVPGGDGKQGDVRPTPQSDACQVIKPCCGGSTAGDGGE
jgi:hypothetical protein